VREFAVEAAKSQPRVLKTPEPICHLVAFADSSVNFSLRFWIDDPNDGITNIRGLVMLALWDVLKREKVELPFPQRDLNLRKPLQVVLGKDPAD
jgi:small-conductance mechanosensitive channel